MYFFKDTDSLYLLLTKENLLECLPEGRKRNLFLEQASRMFVFDGDPKSPENLGKFSIEAVAHELVGYTYVNK